MYAIPCYISMLILFFYFGKDKTPLEMFIFGSLIYAVFDFTNMTIFKEYKLGIGLLDIMWGGILFGSAKFLE